MPGEADIAAIAALLADPTRAAMFFTLSDGALLLRANWRKAPGSPPRRPVNTWVAWSRASFWPSSSRGAIASTIWLIPPLSK